MDNVKDKRILETAAKLRSRAEKLLKTQTLENGFSPSADDALRLLHELQVHQIELEMQNVELRQARDEVESALDRYTDLYDFAPISYFILDREGCVLSANLTAATVLGMERSRLPGQRFGLFVDVEDRLDFSGFLDKVFANQGKEACEVSLTINEISKIFVRIEAIVCETGQECRLAVIDINSIALAETAQRETEELNRKTLQALPAHIAVIDRQGQIIAVNQAWIEFARDNGADGSATVQVGANYCNICRQAATGQDAADAEQALAGVEAVLGGTQDQFTMEYPCHSPHQQRWFLMTVVPLGRGGESGAVITHTDISDRRLTEDALRFLAMYTDSGSGENFLCELASYLAQSLCMDFVCIDRLESDQHTAHTLALFHNGQFEDNISYNLKDTPCGDVVGQNICCFPRNVQKQFPNDMFLQDLQAESYLGTTLWSTEGKPIGLIAVIGRKPLQDNRLAQAVLQLVAPRAAGELESQMVRMELRKSEKRLALATSATSLGIFDWNLAGTTVLWTHTCDTIFGYVHDEITTTTTTTTAKEHDYRRWSDRVHPEDLTFVEEELRHCMQDNLLFHVQYRIIWPDGSLHWVEAKGIFVNDDNDDGKPCRLLGVVMDITERKSIEHEMQARETAIRMAAQKLQTVMDTAPVAICVAYDRDCQFITGNALAHTLLGVPINENVSITAESSQTVPYRVFRDGKEVAGHELPMQLAASTGRVIREEEIEIHRQDGSLVTILMSATPLFDANGTTSGAIGTFLDITKRKQNEQQIQRYVEKLQNLNDELVSFNNAAVGRELRMIELKKEINELCVQAGQPSRYSIDFEDELSSPSVATCTKREQ